MCQPSSVPFSSDDVSSKTKFQTKQDLYQTIFYNTAAFLSLFMVVWILIFPSSWLLGYSKIHDDLVDKLLIQTYDGTFIPPKTLSKYEGQPAVQFTHILPAGLWSLAVPFQLHPDIRKQFPRAHKFTGYIFFVTSILMTIGSVLIVVRDLDFYNDYDIDPSKDIGKETLRLKNEIWVFVQSTWFALTSIVSIYQIAIKRNIMMHQKFIIRHVGSGLGVALQRLMTFALGRASGPLEMRNRFNFFFIFAPLLTMATSEFYLYMMSKSKVLNKQDKNH